MSEHVEKAKKYLAETDWPATHEALDEELTRVVYLLAKVVDEVDALRAQLSEAQARLADELARVERLREDVHTAWSAERECRARLSAIEMICRRLVSRSHHGGYTVLTVDLESLEELLADPAAPAAQAASPEGPCRHPDKGIEADMNSAVAIARRFQFTEPAAQAVDGRLMAGIDRLRAYITELVYPNTDSQLREDISRLLAAQVAQSINEPQHYCASCRYVGFTTSELESHGGTCPICNDGDHIFEFTSWPPHVLPGCPAAQAVADDVVRDAERYLFLRDNEMQWWVATGHWRISRHGSIIAEGVHKNYEAAVDAAILAAQQQKAGGAE